MKMKYYYIDLFGGERVGQVINFYHIITSLYHLKKEPIKKISSLLYNIANRNFTIHYYVANDIYF